MPLTQQPRCPLPGHTPSTVLLDVAPPPHALRLASGFNSLPRREMHFGLVSVGLRLTGVGARGRAWGCQSRLVEGLRSGAGFSPGSTGHIGETSPWRLTSLT